jgi:hypothetical protein
MQKHANCRCLPLIIALWVTVASAQVHSLCAAEPVAAPESDKASVPDKAVELSVAPAGHYEFPSDRPEWIEKLQVRVGETDRLSVTSVPCRDKSLCDESLKVNMRAALENYIEEVTGAEESSSIIRLDDEWIEKHRDETTNYQGTVQAGDETMYESATMLVFDADDRKQIESLWRRNQVSHRLAALGLLSGTAVTLFVGLVAILSIVTRRAEQRITG